MTTRVERLAGEIASLRRELSAVQRSRSDSHSTPVRVARETADVAAREAAEAATAATEAGLVAAAAALAADQAGEVARARSRVTRAAVPPTSEDDATGTDGDLWLVHSGDRIVSVWTHDGTSWTGAPLDAGSVLAAETVVASLLAADAIDGKTIRGATFISEDDDDPGESLVVTSAGLTKTRTNADGEAIVTVSLGGLEGDQLLLAGPDGVPVAGFDPNGDGIARRFSVDSLVVGGRPYEEQVGRLPEVIGYWVMPDVHVESWGSTWTNIGEQTIDIRADHLYQIAASGHWGFRNAAERSNIKGVLRASWSLGNTRPLADGTNVVELAEWESPIPSYSSTVPFGGTEFGFTHWFRGWADETGVRLGWALANWDTTNGIMIAPWARFVVLDHGPIDPALSGTLINERNSTVPEAPPVATYTREYQAAWTRTWKGGAVTSGYLFHGYYSSQGYSFVRLPDALRDDVMGASSVSAISVYLRCVHTYSSAGMSARVGSSVLLDPGSPQSTDSYPAAHAFRAGEARWVNLPISDGAGGDSVHSARLKAGNFRGLVLGEGAGTSRNNYGYFSAAHPDIRVRVTYTK